MAPRVPGAIPPGPPEAAIARLHESEELAVALGSRLKAMERDLQDLRLPGFSSRPFLADTVALVDVLAPTEAEPSRKDPTRPGTLTWGLAPRREVPAGDATLLGAFLDGQDTVDDVTTGVVAAAFLDPGKTRWRAVVSFGIRGRTREGALRSAAGRLHLTWTKREPAPEGASKRDPLEGWRLREVELASFESRELLEALFREETARALPDPSLYRRLRATPWENEILARLENGLVSGLNLTENIRSGQRHPSLTVVDIDRDGADDLFLAQREGRSVLLWNRGDGRFEDRTAAFGLGLEQAVAPLFADFDNDGDPDLFLGSARPSAPAGRSARFFRNDGGVFVDASAAWLGELRAGPVTSIAGADYDGDGWLDVYLSTLASREIHKSLRRREAKAKSPVFALPLHDAALEALVSPEILDGLRSRVRPLGNSVVLWRTELPGPPNLLLRNTGRGFVRSPVAEGVEGWRNTFQASWADYDGDGDPDLYLANDFSPNHLYRNDGAVGFTDVTTASGTTDQGFGMGVTWGDYDEDGDLDLYVANMYSKAGKRVMSGYEAAQVPVEPRLKDSARGNTLLRNEGDGRFTRVSTAGPPGAAVAKGGWAWGVTFLDPDADGRLDLYSPCGWFTPPERVARAGDF
jgi:hypothetical protein